jgi:hypothetical protein
VNLVLDRLARGFLGSLKERANIDVKPDSGEGGGDDLGAAVMPVLPKFGDEHAGAPALFAGKGVDLALHAAEGVVVPVLTAIDATDRADLGTVAAKRLFEGVGDLANRRARPHRANR